MELEQKPKQENTAAGTLGALLGALAGLVCIVLMGRLNIAASLFGLVLAVCALKGYEKLAGTLSKRGAVISCAVILFMTYLAHHLDITVGIVQALGMSFPDAFVSVPKLLRLDILNGSVFWGNLAWLYLFAILGASPMLRRCMVSSAAAQIPVQGPTAENAQEAPFPKPVPSHWGKICIAIGLVLAFGALGLAADTASLPEQDGADALFSASSSLSGENMPGITVTWENYQSLFHLAQEDGFQYLGMGFLPVPAGAFGENMFVPVYVPWCDAPVYSADGSTLTAAAHGMQVDGTVVPAEGSARDTVEAMYSAFAASGADLYEERVSETEYSEQYGVAVKQVVYFEGNGALPRISLFYTDEPYNGCCYSARITWLPEQRDEETSALLQELGEVFGLSLPEMEPYHP